MARARVINIHAHAHARARLILHRQAEISTDIHLIAADKLKNTA
jgi:hypothetical protein